MLNPGPAAFAKSGSWPTYMGGNSRTGFNQAETTINPQTAPNLKVHWKHLAGGKVTSQPIVANGLVYWGSWDGLEHATDPATGNDVWTANLGQTVITCSGVVQGALSTATVSTISLGGIRTPVLFVGGGDVQFYALNANTGAVIWQTPLGTQPDYFLYSSPAVYKGSIYVGVSSHNDCPLVQGEFVKLNAVTGAIQHIFKTVPDGCTGGSVWGSPSIDAATNIVYFGTGNPYNCTSTETMTESLIALHMSDLSLVASWQVPAIEVSTDGDFGSTPTLFDATIGGLLHHMVGLMNKNGIYYAFDRANISSGPLWEVRLAAPTMHEESNISSSAWNGTTLYAAAASTTINGTSCGGSLRALDPATGNFLWQDCLPSDVLGPVTAIPGVLEVGTHSFLFVMDAATGNQLFSFQDKTIKANFLGPGCIADGILYHGNTDGYLYAFGL
jgi:polyvinyl alcohol dehydrogenase (cytochrome)